MDEIQKKDIRINDIVYVKKLEMLFLILDRVNLENVEKLNL